MKKLVILKCEICGNVCVKLVDVGVPVFCCGKVMQTLEANTTDAAVEKHKPVIKTEGNLVKVCVGEVAHPMLNEHNISFILLQTSNGFYVNYLNVNSAPETEFVLKNNETVVNVYAYCNLHGLWA